MGILKKKFVNGKDRGISIFSIRSRFITPDTSVVASISEIKLVNGVVTPFIGAARMKILKVVPVEGRV
jgi:hypothetical protein